MKIIVTDDDAMNLRMAEFILKKNGFEAVKTASGKECIDAVKSQGAALVLLDILMPEMDGFETLRRIRECEEGKDIPVIFLTADAALKDQQEAAEFRDIPFVAKPLKPDTLMAKIKEILG